MKLYLRSKHTIALLLAILAIVGFTASDKIDFYYFFPDSSQNNLGNLKKEMDTFFNNKNVVIGFQPFLRFSDFMHKIKENMPEFILAPEWLLKQYADELSLKPFLVPSRNGSTSYTKILMVKKDSGIDLKNMKDKTLALTSMGPMSDDILNDILFSEKNVDACSVKKIKVSKDSDAIFALALGQVDMALVVRDNLEKIERIYPKIVSNLIPLLESKPLSMPVLCYFEKNVSLESVEKMRNLFISKENTKEFSEIGNMLQIDKWIP
ncbi:MAG: PhnD/SsuA/transferrin family substrate-binding protein [Proteobacteria bacterium]|nr:PhnD/SsuA/transferrin family substrate-binding protein [Pseudomonadota bacterium]